MLTHSGLARAPSLLTYEQFYIITVPAKNASPNISVSSSGYETLFQGSVDIVDVTFNERFVQYFAFCAWGPQKDLCFD